MGQWGEGQKTYKNHKTNNNLQIGANGSNIFNVSTASIYPDTDNSVDLGLSNRRFQDVYAVNYYGDGSNLTGVGSTTAGAVGTYAALHLSSNAGTSFGTTRSGSQLRHANFYRDGNNNTTVSGTWRCMGQTGTYSGNNAGGSDTMGTIWVRIS